MLLTGVNPNYSVSSGAPAAHWVMRWPVDLMAQCSIPAGGGYLLNVNGDQLHTAFHHHPPVVLI